MLLSRLTSQVARASRFAGQLLSKTAALRLNPGASASYCTHPSSKNGAQPQQQYVLDPELEEMLVPRKMSISPLESWLTVRYSLPKGGAFVDIHEKLEDEPTQLYDLPPCPRDPEEQDGGELAGNKMECKNVLEQRRRKMNRHKYWKLRKRQKFLRKKILESRRKRKQKRFEKDLERIWRRAGLKTAPEGWVTPKIFIKNLK